MCCITYCKNINADNIISRPLEILLHPKDVNCKPGSQVEFSISVTSSAASFQWYFQESIIDATNSDYEGSYRKDTSYS